MITRQINPEDIDFGNEAMRPPRKPGMMLRAGGYRIMRPTHKGPVCIGRVQSLDVARKVAQNNDWIEEVPA